MRAKIQKILKEIKEWRNDDDAGLGEAIDLFGEIEDNCELIESLPRIVCLCGSTRFMDAFQRANLKETIKGNIVLSVGCNTKSDAELELVKHTKVALDELHKRKIDLADEILVLNVGGYIGESTQSEINYALLLGKPIRYLIAID